ncbi:protein kinase [Archangium violaceum]|uniref:protein kinase domain-containing protein n=1 Tax=Archangium violaceum TaxID=83451 RepID=UPI00193BE218|nr:protein kinase [Archangium violaceum]QRK07923.1 protein kinase [Archangium violaceum]
MDSIQDDMDFGDSLLEEVVGTDPWLASPVPGEKLGGPDGRRFEIQLALGRGSMGEVFQAWDAELQREVALKFLNPQTMSLGSRVTELLQQEARAIARLNHENIVRLFDVAEWRVEHGEQRVLFLVMEYLEGESLSARLHRGRLELKQAMTIMEGVAAGLAHAHQRHLIHRDLKPANVFITREETVKLLDFGLAHLVASTLPLPDMSTAGTPLYMAPEQWLGRPQDERTDVWAAGLLLYELLTGKRPFSTLCAEELRARVISAEPVPSVRALRPELSRELEQLVATALAKDPARRIPSGQELLEELREVSEHLGLRREQGQTSVAQRRQVTLVCCVPLGLPAALDPEDFDELEAAFRETCAELLGHHGGSLTPSMGAQVLACFGYPQAQEEDSRNAVHAAMLLARDFPRMLQRKLPRPFSRGLSMGVGIHTDRVALHESAGGPVLSGDAPEVVAWLARQAEPGTVLLSEATRTLVRGAFEMEPLGTRRPTGAPAARPVRVFRALSERKTRSRFERMHAAFGLTPLVGRERELREVLELWASARRGQGTAVLLRGEAGLGKSRLIHEVRERVASEADCRLNAQCGAPFSSSALYPVIDLLQRLLEDSRPEGASPGAPRGLEPRLRALGLSAEHLQALVSLLSLPPMETLPSTQLTPERQKSLVFDALAILLRGLARERPVLVVVEDLHWADPSTLELLVWLHESVSQSRVLLLLSSRAEPRDAAPRWPGLHILSLERLSEKHTQVLVREAARGRVLTSGVMRQLVKRTEGVPLFAEELTRMMLERQAAGDVSSSIPSSLHELLLARLDALPPRQKMLAQLCSVMGRSFSSALVAALTHQSEAARIRDLEGLVSAGILEQEGPDEELAEYRFRHALIQEAAYQSLLRGTRREYHQRIALVLEESFPELAEAHPELLAHHYTEAAWHTQALLWWTRAGAHASQRSAHQEAIEHLTRALNLLRTLPDAGQRQGEELRLLMTLGIPLVQARGYQSADAERTFARARSLFDAVGDELPRLELSYWGAFSFYLGRGELSPAWELAERLVAQGQRLEDRELLALGHGMMAMVAFTRGQGRAAREHAELALGSSHFTLDEHRRLALRHWVEPRVKALAYGSLILSWGGDLERARIWGQEALALAGRLGHLHTSAFALHSVAQGSQYWGDVVSTLELAERCMALSSEHHFRMWRSGAALLRGWALAGMGWVSQGLALMRQGIEQWRASGIQSYQSHHCGMLAEIYLWQRQPQQALEVVERALTHLGEERFYASALHRLRGEGLRALGQEQEAEASFKCALEIAREQGAHTFERLARQRLKTVPPPTPWPVRA